MAQQCDRALDLMYGVVFVSNFEHLADVLFARIDMVHSPDKRVVASGKRVVFECEV